jgi:hypothetical protein
VILDVNGFYKMLEVQIDAQPEEIRAAHKRLSKIWHPDINPCATATETMTRINEAFRVLSDPKARYNYDRLAPPPPQVTTSSSSVQVGRFNKKIVITITSNRPIKDVSCDHLSGYGWEATIRIVSECSLDVIFSWSRDSAIPAQDFTAVIDGTPIQISVASKKARLDHRFPPLIKVSQPVTLYLLHIVSFYAGLIGIYCQIKAYPLLQFSGSRDQFAAHLLLYASLGLGLSAFSFYVVGNITGSLPHATPISFAALLAAHSWVANGPLMNGKSSPTGMNIIGGILLGAMLIFIYNQKKLVR